MLEISIRKQFPKGAKLDISFETDAGFTVLFGRSGAGKSVTLASIAGLTRPDSGRISVGGRVFFDSADKVNVRPQDRRVGYVFQHYALFPHLTVAQNIEIGLKYGQGRKRRDGGEPGQRQGGDAGQVAAADNQGGALGSQGGQQPVPAMKLDELIDELGIASLMDRRPDQLSGGQQQRVAIARALSGQPDILLLDEPFSALDAPVRDRLRSLVRRIQQRHGFQVLLITHQPFEAYNLAEKLIVIENGSVVQQGTPDSVFYRPDKVSIARLVGVKNIFDGEIVALTDDHIKILASGVTFEADVPGNLRALEGAARALSIGDKITWCIRPEDVMILRGDRPHQKEAVRENQLGGVITEAEKHGPTWELLFVGENGMPLKIQVPAHAGEMLGAAPGVRVGVSLKRKSIHVIAPQRQ